MIVGTFFKCVKMYNFFYIITGCLKADSSVKAVNSIFSPQP